MIDRDRRLLLAARRERLLQRAAVQRVAFADAVAPLAQAVAWAERGLLVGQVVRRRPWLLAVPAALLLWWRPRGLLRALAGASALWRLAH